MSVPRFFMAVVMGCAAVIPAAACENADAKDEPVPRAAEFRSPRLDQALESASALLATRGFREDGPADRGFLVERDAEVHDASMRAGSCYVVVVVGSSSLEDLELRIFDSDGAEVARTTTTGPRTAVQYCPTQSGTYYIGKRVSAGNGLFAARIFRGPTGLDVRLDDLFRDAVPPPGSSP